MELKHDCIRDLLLELEKNLKLNQTLSVSDIANLSSMKCYHQDDIVYTINKLDEAGFIKSISYMGGGLDVSEITYYGHQFLDNVRGNSIWSETKSQLSKVEGAASLSVISELASSLVKAKLGIN
ncbi:DUF2513 domain-containing protein [Bacillus paralicheniformis]|uniref:DUF2513 domain-containing protein n=1 Tax=Bacillus paralicheniformis TaxID=1648923 RepID=UPI001C5860F5|nr:DUF2513 domain-containing protein [Bacillus paralicheniformis]